MKVALTGHRPERLKGHEKEVRDWIKKQFIKINPTLAYSGMAQGADQIFADVSVELDVPLICCYPFKKDYFHPHEQRLINKACSVKFVNEKYSKKSYFIRDKYMVDNCDILLAVWDGIEAGGTWITIDYARKIGKEIVYFPKELLNEP